MSAADWVSGPGKNLALRKTVRETVDQGHTVHILDAKDPAPVIDRAHATAVIAEYQARPQPAQLPLPNPVAETVCQVFLPDLNKEGTRGQLDFVVGWLCINCPDAAFALLDAIVNGDRP